MLAAEASGDKDALLTSQVRLRSLNEEYRRYSKAVKLPAQCQRAEAAGFGFAEATDARKAAKTVEKIANSLYNLGNIDSNVNAYMRNKPIHDFLDKHKIKFVSQIDSKEFIVDAGKPIIISHTGHSLENLQSKADRANMTLRKRKNLLITLN